MLINRKINDYLRKVPISFHMPGHKGREINDNFFANSCPLNNAGKNKYLDIKFDVTEIDETLNIYDTSPFNEQIFRKTASYFDADITLYSCGGATLAIQAALFNIAAYKTVLCCHDAHVSAENAFILSSITPIYINEVTEELILTHRPAAVFLCSVDYYGRIQIENIQKSISICKKHSIPVIIDNSHGTHLAFYNNKKLHPVFWGADIIIDSAHKTLPVLTGGALLHLQGIFAKNWHGFVNSIKLFATTSPSYLIASSIEYGVLYMVHNNKKLIQLKLWCDNLRNVLRLKGCLFYDDFNIITDPFRISIILQNAKEVNKVLKNNNIFSEFSNDNHIVLIPSIMNDEKDFITLKNILNEIDLVPLNKEQYNNLINNLNKKKKPLILDKLPREAAMGEKIYIDTKFSADYIAAESLYNYPPAIPIIHTGQKIDSEIINTLTKVSSKIYVCKTM